MNWLQLHPDGIVYVRDAADAPVYEASLADFALDNGQPFPMPVPLDGREIAGLELFEGAIYAYDPKGNELEVAGRIDAAPYQAIIDDLTKLQAAKQTRLNPPPPAPTLASTQAAKLRELTRACGAQIIGGFMSSALGSAYSYPSAQTDQDNLSASVVASLLPGIDPATWTTPFMCEAANGIWARRAHSQAQIQQVGVDGKNFVVGCLLKLDSLRTQVAACTTMDQVNAIVWS